MCNRSRLGAKAEQNRDLQRLSPYRFASAAQDIVHRLRFEAVLQRPILDAQAVHDQARFRGAKRLNRNWVVDRLGRHNSFA